MIRCKVFAVPAIFSKKNWFSAIFRSPCEFLATCSELDQFNLGRVDKSQIPLD